MLYPLHEEVNKKYTEIRSGDLNFSEAIDMFGMLFFYVFNMMIAGLLTMFLKFHIKLASENKTTIEELERKSKYPNERNYISKFDVGENYNWSLVMGTNKFLWPFPFFGLGGKPNGDGVYWQCQ